MTNKNSSPVSSSVGSCVLRSTGWSLSPGSSGGLSEGPTSITRLSPMRASRPATLSTSPVLVYPVWVVQWYLSWMKRPGHVWEEFFRQRPTWNTLLNVKYFLNSSLIYLYFPPKSGITACLLPCYSTQGPGGCQRKRTKYTSWCHYSYGYYLGPQHSLHPPPATSLSTNSPIPWSGHIQPQDSASCRSSVLLQFLRLRSQKVK